MRLIGPLLAACLAVTCFACGAADRFSLEELIKIQVDRESLPADGVSKVKVTVTLHESSNPTLVTIMADRGSFVGADPTKAPSQVVIKTPAGVPTSEAYLVAGFSPGPVNITVKVADYVRYKPIEFKAAKWLTVTPLTTGKIAADGVSKLKIEVQVPVGAKSQDVRLTVQRGTLVGTGSVEGNAPKSLAGRTGQDGKAAFFLLSDRIPGRVPFAVTVAGFTEYGEVQFVRYCPSYISLVVVGSNAIAADGSSTVSLKAQVFNSTDKGGPSVGLPVIWKVSQTGGQPESLGRLDSSVTFTDEKGESFVRLRSGTVKGTVDVTASAPCIGENASKTPLSDTIKVLYR